MLVSSGLRHYEAMAFGGMKSATEAVHRKPDVLALPKHAFWSRYDSKGNASYRAEPKERRDHTMNYSAHSQMHDHDGGGIVVMFGGRDVDGVVLDSVWVGWRLGYDEAESWSWIQPNRVNWPGAFAGRYEHSAIVVPGSVFNATDVYVYGGRKDATSPTDELWKITFKVLSGGIPHTNNSVEVTAITNATGPSPGVRYGHTAVLDEKDEVVGVNTVKRRRMLVFGGRDATGALADDAVYSLDLGANPPSWSIVTPASPNQRRSRYRHAAIMDGQSAYLVGTKPRRMIVHGGEATGGLSDTTYILRRCDDNISCLTSYQWESPAHPAQPPAARYQHAAIYDQQWHRMLIMGGQKSLAGDQYDAKVFELPLESSDTYPYNTTLAWAELATDSLGSDIEPRAGHSLIWNQRYVVEKYAEIYDPKKPPGQQWSEVPNAPIYDQWTYPFYFMMPSGSVFYAGRSTRSPGTGGAANNDAETRLLARPGEDPSGWTWGSTRYKSYVGGNGAVMFEPGKVMKFGQPSGNPTPDQATVKRIEFDANNGTSGWVTEAPATDPADRPHPRFESNLTLLPDGNVLVSGGRNKHQDDGVAFKNPQIWYPYGLSPGNSNKWSGQDDLAQDLTTRGYHSTAVLTPDARVLSAGGSRLNNPQPSVGLDMRGWLTVFDPPYLFDPGSSTPATRPALSSVPDTILYGNCYELQASSIPSGLAKLSLIRPGATTHAFNMDQYFVPIVPTSVSPSGLVSFNAPANGHIAPPADALLFGIASTAQRTPSLGEWVTVGPRHDLLDAHAPSAVSTFTVIPDHCGQFARAYWTERPDDSTFASSGRVRLHDVRWSTSSLSGWSQFLSANQIACEPAPRGPGAELSVAVTLGPGSYSFRHVSWDDRWPYDRSSPMSAVRTVTLDGCGGGGGGPFIDGGGEGGGLSARRAADENSGASVATVGASVLGGAAPGEVVTDEVRIEHPVRAAPDRVRVRLFRGAGGSTRVVSASLTAVDHSPGAEVARLSGAWTAVERVPATSASVGTESLGDRLEGRADLFLVGDTGDTITVGLPAVPQGFTETAVYVDAVASRGASAAPARIGLASAVSAVEFSPRDRRTILAGGSFGSGDITLSFSGNAAVHAVGRLIPTGQSVSVSAASLVSASHSRLGGVHADSLRVGTDLELLEGDTLTMEFTEPALAAGSARDLWLGVRGAQHGEAGTLAGRSREWRDESMEVAFALLASRPNPTRGTTTLPFTLLRAGMVGLEVFDLQGRRVHDASGWRPAGRHEHAWDLRGRDGQRVAPGIYSYRLQLGDTRAERRLVVLP